MAETGRATLLDRTLSRLYRVWRDVAGPQRRALAGELDPALPEADAERLRAAMRACLEGEGGAASARARAADLGRAYLELNPAGRRRFLRILAADFDIDPAAVEAAIARFQSAPEPDARRAAAAELRNALRPPRIVLLMQFNSLPEGIKFLVDLRAELAAWAREDSALRTLEADLKQLLGSWFDVGLLRLERITWRSPAALLERLVDYEAVHEIRSWQDLKNRLDSDRRCFAFFHPSMPEEPVIFVEVALVNGMAGNIELLLDESAPPVDPASADSAIFYSISNTQQGLIGISLGDFLIKQVVDALRHEFPNLKTFATLSPIPGFRRWLDGTLAADGGGLVTVENARVLRDLLDRNWAENPTQAGELRTPLLRLGAHYLLEEKRHGRALDPVANFHLTNGARLARLNWLADRSAKGLSASAGMMVNYQYKSSEIEANHEAYRARGRIVASAELRNLLKS